MHNLTDKCLKNLVKDLNDFLKKCCQDKARSWFQIHARSYCDGHARSHVKIVVRFWKFFSMIIQESCYRTMQDLSQDKAKILVPNTLEILVPNTLEILL